MNNILFSRMLMSGPVSLFSAPRREATSNEPVARPYLRGQLAPNAITAYRDQKHPYMVLPTFHNAWHDSEPSSLTGPIKALDPDDYSILTLDPFLQPQSRQSSFSRCLTLVSLFSSPSSTLTCSAGLHVCVRNLHGENKSTICATFLRRLFLYSSRHYYPVLRLGARRDTVSFTSRPTPHTEVHQCYHLLL
ncbi:hypothetical protein BJV74DRAFT_94191 [Russula compacta]|nr:hypothetical protein BJV74DRAFT_94191 [Russula compacta]